MNLSSTEQRIQLEHFSKNNECILILSEVLKGKMEYALCVSLNLKGGQESNPKLHSLKLRPSRQYNLKRTWDLKFLQHIEASSRNLHDITFWFYKKAHIWNFPLQSQLNAFLWCVLEVCRQYHSVIPQITNINLFELDTKGRNWLRIQLSLTNNDINKQMLLSNLSQKLQSRLEEKSREDQKINLPSMTLQESNDLENVFLASELPISRIDNLSNYLESKVYNIESDNLQDVFSFENQKLNVIDSIGEIIKETDQLQNWMKKHNDELSKMRIDIEHIEKKNVKLENTYKNLEILQKTLSDLLNSLQVSVKSQNVLRNSEFTDLSSLQKASLELQTIIRYIERLDPSICHMAAVNEKRKELKDLQTIFVQNIYHFFENQFIEKSKYKDNNHALCDHSEIHIFFSDFKSLIASLQELDMEQFLKIRQFYASCFHSFYEKEFVKLFQKTRSSILLYHRDCRLSAFTQKNQNIVNSKNIDNPLFYFSNIPAIETDLKGPSSFPTSFSRLFDIITITIQEEQNFCLEFFYMDVPFEQQNQKEINNLLDILFEGLIIEFHSFLLWADKIDHLAILAVLNQIWKLYSQHHSYEGFFHNLLSSLQSSLLILWTNYIQDQVKWIENYRVQAKQAGVLSPLVHFHSWIEIIEQIVDNEDFEYTLNAYHKLATVLFHMIKTIASTNNKYADVVIMENHHYFWFVFSHRVPKISALESFVNSSFETYKKHLDNYVQWNISYENEMKPLINFWNKLTAQLQTTDIHDIPFIDGLQKQDLRLLIQEHYSHKRLTIGISSMYKRISRHIHTSLIVEIWSALEQYFTERIRTFEHLVAECYQAHERLPVSVPEISAIFRQFIDEKIVVSTTTQDIISEHDILSA